MIEHEAFCTACHDCSEGHKDVSGRLEACAGTAIKDATEADKQLGRLRDIVREAGFSRLQLVSDSGQVAAANTAPSGRQQVSRKWCKNEQRMEGSDQVI